MFLRKKDYFRRATCGLQAVSGPEAALLYIFAQTETWSRGHVFYSCEWI
jgi:hypothetical protein